ncbi:hypothetical protein GCM10010399_18550 [Dactylosporangium fulvum]|uniref:Integral membrane protein n=1 Tax=Dactylosporangium fulvum TaxID=53359 RepID=A0ABY5VU27_9ACTN|nr:hypothetical protein [Dactylosporangium fulvum]UWP80324.1 hypothetical protein Dfulv_34895 [Dactylosporangium fulvum]
MTDELRDRYRTLLRWYPADYRAERGDEIIETYLDLAAPGQRRPRPADVADLVRGGLRQHLRARHALGLTDALPFAGHLALAAATALAVVWLILAERITVPNGIAWQTVGPFATLGAVAWIAWLLASLAALIGAGRPAVACALLVTAALVPVAAVTPYPRPPLFVLLPQIALGIVALAVPGRRWSPAVATGIVVAAAVAGLTVLSWPPTFYYSLLGAMPYAGLSLVTAVIVAGIVFGVRRDPRGWWSALILLGPVLLLVMTAPTTTYPQPWPTWPTAVGSTIVAVLTAIAAVPATLWLRGRLSHRPAERCPTCGR